MYDQQVMPHGELNVQSSPQDFGSEVGAGLENLGQGIQNASDSERAIAADKAQVWAIKSASDARLTWIQNMQAAQTDPDFAKKYGADGSGFVGAMKSGFEDYANQQLINAPSPQSKYFLEQQLRSLGGDLMKDAIGFQAQTGASWSTQMLTETGDQNARAAFIAPQQYQSIVDNQVSAIDQIPYLTPEQRTAAKEKGKEDVAFAAGKGLAQTAPEALLGNLRPEELQKFRPTSRVVKALNSNLAIALPKDTGADLVKPYRADRIAQIIKDTNAPSKFDNIFHRAADAYGVDWKELKMRAVAEGGMNPDAVGPETSSGKAKGLMQFTDAMAKSLGIDPTNPTEAVFAAAKLLAGYAGKAGGDQAQVDKMYYGGQSNSNWGKNTEQYAENLAAVRATMGGGGTNPASYQEVLDNVLSDKQPVRSSAMPDWFNELPWDKQYAIIEDAKQGVRANQARDLQQITFQKEQLELQNKQAMSEGIDKIVDGKMTVGDIRNDGRLNFEGKKALLEAMTADLTGLGKTDYKVFDDTYNRIHLPEGDPNRITGEDQLVPLVGHGLSFENVKQLRDELAGKDTASGKALGELKAGFMKAAESQITKTTLTQRDSVGDAQFYKFQQSFLTQYAAKVKAGINPYDLLDPNSKEYMGGLVSQYARTPQQAMSDMAKSMKGAPGGAMLPAEKPKTVPHIDPLKDKGAWDNLKSGEPFITPDGAQRTKP